MAEEEKKIKKTMEDLIQKAKDTEVIVSQKDVTFKMPEGGAKPITVQEELAADVQKVVKERAAMPAQPRKQGWKLRTREDREAEFSGVQHDRNLVAKKGKHKK